MTSTVYATKNRRTHGTMWLGAIPPACKKPKRPHPGTQILSQISKGGEGNRGQMPHICPGFTPPPPSGLILIEALLALKEDFYCLSARIPWIRVLIISDLIQVLKGSIVCLFLSQHNSLTFSFGTSSGKFSLLGLGKSGNRVPPGAAVTHELVPWLVFCRECPWVLSSASVLLYDWLKLA